MSNQEQLTSETYTWAPDAQGAKDGPGMLAADQRLTVQCPKCGERFGVSAVASIPDEQKLSMVLEHSSPFIAATTLGESITNMSKLLVAVAEEIGGKVAVMVSGCELSQGKTKIDFVITSIKS